MKITKGIIVVLFCSFQFMVSLTPAGAHTEARASITQYTPNEKLQLINNGFQSKLVRSVDLFPAQSWASLRDDMSNTIAPLPAPPVETVKLPPPLPFTVVGEWLEDSQHIIVLESMGETYLLCNSCELSNAIKVGDTLAQKYELKSLDNRQLILINEHGEEQSITY